MATPHMVLQIIPQMVPGARFKHPVQIKENNKVATTDVPRRRRNPTIIEMCNFIRAHPLYGAFFNENIIFPPMLNEWWYTCKVSEDQESITGTIEDGSIHITITEEIIRRSLNLPSEEEAGQDGFQPRLSKQEARDEAFPLIGQHTTTGIIRYSMFSGRWKLLFSFVVRCLGGKVGSTDQMNEFETHLFHAMVTGRNISFSQLYFDELVSQTIEQTRAHNVPFIRVISLCLETVLGAHSYNDYKEAYIEYQAPKLSTKIFFLQVEDDEELTPAMLHWIENPYHAPSDAESDQSEPEGGMGDGHEEKEENYVQNDAGSPLHRGSGMMFLLSKSLQSDSIPCQTEAQFSKTELLVHSETNPVNPHGLLVNSSDSSPTQNQALLEQSNQEDDVHVTHSSALKNPHNPVLEQVKFSSTKTNPSLNCSNNLESHISTLTLTHVRSIEQDVPLLDIPVLGTGRTPLFQSESSHQTHNVPFLKAILSSASLGHYTKPNIFLHPTALVANVPLLSQSGIQTSTSTSNDPLPYKQERREDAKYTESEKTQFEVSTLMLLNSLKNMASQFDDKLTEMQSELHGLKFMSISKELEEMQTTVNTMSAEIGSLKRKEPEQRNDQKGNEQESEQFKSSKETTPTQLAQTQGNLSEKELHTTESDQQLLRDGQSQGEKKVDNLKKRKMSKEENQPLKETVQPQVTRSDAVNLDDVASSLEEDQVRLEADKKMLVKIIQEQDRQKHLNKHFLKRSLASRIIHLSYFEENNQLCLSCLLENKSSYKISLENMKSLGYEEWKRIADLSSRINEENVATQIIKEAILNVNCVFYLKKIDKEEYDQFCTRNHIHRGARSHGIEDKSEHPIPKGLKFEDRMYIKTEDHEGLFFRDMYGEECFQDINGLSRCSIYHNIALMNECKLPNALPFRKKLLRWLLKNMNRINEIGLVEHRVQMIKSEFQKLHELSDEETKVLLERIFKEHLEKNEATKQSLNLSSPMKKLRSKKKLRK